MCLRLRRRRERWWRTLDWLERNAEHLETEALIAVLDELYSLAQTSGQRAMIDGIAREAVMGITVEDEPLKPDEAHEEGSSDV